MKLGLLINLHEALLENGITRITNGLEGKDYFNQTSRPSRPSRDLDFSL
jgi:hypothetical protein